MSSVNVEFDADEAQSLCDEWYAARQRIQSSNPTGLKIVTSAQKTIFITNQDLISRWIGFFSQLSVVALPAGQIQNEEKWQMIFVKDEEELYIGEISVQVYLQIHFRNENYYLSAEGIVDGFSNLVFDTEEYIFPNEADQIAEEWYNSINHIISADIHAVRIVTYVFVPDAGGGKVEEQPTINDSPAFIERWKTVLSKIQVEGIRRYLTNGSITAVYVLTDEGEIRVGGFLESYIPQRSRRYELKITNYDEVKDELNSLLGK
jgi:hypothetical protein